jgi:hypothetical protein
VVKQRKAHIFFGGCLALIGAVFFVLSLSGAIRLLTATEPPKLDAVHEQIVRLSELTDLNSDVDGVLLEGDSRPRTLFLTFKPDVESLEGYWGFGIGWLVLENVDGSQLILAASASSISGNGSDGEHWGSKIGGGPGVLSLKLFFPECRVTLPATVLQFPPDSGHTHKTVIARATMRAVYPVSHGQSFTNESTMYSHQFTITIVPGSDIQLKHDWDSWNNRRTWPGFILVSIVAAVVFLAGCSHLSSRIEA